MTNYRESSMDRNVHAEPGKQVQRELVMHGSTDGLPASATIQYLLFLPRKYSQAEQLWPLLLFLHGAGERGTDLELVKKHGPPKIVERDPDFPFVVVSPQCRANERWNVAELNQLVDVLAAEYRVDTARIYITGLSMGGFGTWSLCAAYPNRFAAAVPICGGGNPAQAAHLSALPLWAFHGAHDQIVTLQQSESMVKAVEAAGGNVKFTVYPNAAHDSWTMTYDNPAVFEWLLQQRLDSAPGA
jgi:predicted peptidase